jgi:hypothetical protein
MCRPKYVFLIFIIAGAFAINGLLSGCKKCYYCFYPFDTVKCVRASDSLIFDCIGNCTQQIVAYRDSGYICDTQTIGYSNGTGGLSNQQCTLGKDAFEQAVAAGDSCGINE